MVNPAAFVCFLSPFILSFSALETFFPSCPGPGSRPVLGYGSGLCLLTNEAEDYLYSRDAAPLQRSGPVDQSKDYSPVQKNPSMGSIHLRHMASVLLSSLLTMVNSKGMLLPASATSVAKISASI